MGDKSEATRRMLEASSIAVVGASARPGSFGDRLAREALNSPCGPTVHFVHPKYSSVHGHPCVPTLGDVPDPVDLVLLGVPDHALVDQVAAASDRGDGGAVVFGSAVGLGERLTAAAAAGGLALCGAGCMGFVNASKGVRAIGYVERPALGPGPVALITHSGSIFSALLRTHRDLAFSLAVSSGQELVTTTADYLAYAALLDETRVIGLFLETIRDVTALRAGLALARERDIAVAALTVGGSPTGRAMVNAHSGALAGNDGAWEALFTAYGVHRVRNLDELVDTLEVFARSRRPQRPRRSAGHQVGGIATLHDSGGERALVADAAHAENVPFATLNEHTRARLTELLAPGLSPDNPLDVWGTGRDTEALFTGCMEALAADPNVDVIVLAVDLFEEYDGDEAYPRAVESMLGRTAKPIAVLSNSAAVTDVQQAHRLREAGVPVLEGTVSGLRALKHLLDHSTYAVSSPEPLLHDLERQRRWRERLARSPLDSRDAAQLVIDYGIAAAVPVRVGSDAEAVSAAEVAGYPVVLKTARPGVHHKVDVAGVAIGLTDRAAVVAAYADLDERLGPAVDVEPMVDGDVELALGVVQDPMLGSLVVLAVGGVLVEVVGQRRVALAPLTTGQAEAMINGLPVVAALLEGVRGRPPVDRAAVASALVSISQLASELGDVLDAVDVNPLKCGPLGATAVDVLVLARRPLATPRPRG